jgi:hypothetical protein
MHAPFREFTLSACSLHCSGEIEKIYNKWFTPLGAPMSDMLRTAFAIQALPE